MNLSSPNHLETISYTYVDGKSRSFVKIEANGCHIAGFALKYKSNFITKNQINELNAPKSPGNYKLHIQFGQHLTSDKTIFT